MYLERIFDPVNETYKYINGKGTKFNIRDVFIDGKKVAADIIRIDTKEGWVDIEIPHVLKLEEIETIIEEGKTATFSNKIKRISGVVKVSIMQ